MAEGISPLDMVLILPLLWGVVRGLRKGLILEVSGLAALFLGAYAALFCSDIAAHWLDAEFDLAPAYLGITAFALTFIAVAIGVHLLGRLLEKTVDISALKPFDRLGGLVFATARAWLFLSIVVMLVEGTVGSDLFPSEWRGRSHLWPGLEWTARWLLPILDRWVPQL